jgi:UDP-glucose 4-epimerase
MKIAITGASGFIGKHVVAAALARGHEITCPPRWKISSYDFWRDLQGVDVVCHLAAHIPIHMADRHPDTFRECFEANVLLTSKILRAAEIAGVKRFVNFGSGNAYGLKIDYPDESSPLYPTSRGTPYLASKVAQETIVAAWHGLETCTLRLGSVYGPGLKSGMLYHLIRRLLRGDTVVLEKGGAYGADYVSVHDVAQVAVDACKSSATGPFNIGSGRRVTIKTLAEMIRGITGSGTIVVNDADRAPRFIGFPALNIARAIIEFGFSCQLLQPGLVEYVEWLRTSGDDDVHQGRSTPQDVRGRDEEIRQDTTNPPDRAPDVPAAGEHLGSVLCRP